VVWKKTIIKKGVFHLSTSIRGRGTHLGS